jgi:hypothetical protein
MMGDATMLDGRLHHLIGGMQDEGMLLCFNGPFFHEIIEALGTAMRKCLETAELKKTVLMDVFSVYIELTQNVKNYAALKARTETERQEIGNGAIIIGKSPEGYWVSSRNLVEKEDIPTLTERLDKIAASSKQQLKALYKEQMRKPPGPTGAGLGLIDIARRAARPLEYSFTAAAGDHCSFFRIHVVI